MTTYYPISFTVPQYEDSSGNPYSGAVLKAYSAGTSTAIVMATDYTGGTTVSTVTLNSSGFPAVSGNVIIPHIGENYKLALYPTSAAATANTGAIWTVDNIQISSTVSSGALTDVASATTVNLNSTETDYFNITGTTTITGVTLADGAQVTVKFAGILTITNGSFLITGTGANITTAVGATAALRGESGGVVRVLWYRRGGGSYRGAAAYNTAAQSIPASTNTVLTFDSEIYDTDSIHSTSSNTGRMTVPAGVTKVRLRGNYRSATATDQTQRTAKLYKNGALYDSGSSYVPFFSGVTSGTSLASDCVMVTPAITCVAGDYFELVALQNEAGANNAFAQSCFFEMEILE